MTDTINKLEGEVSVDCDSSTGSCNFQQSVLSAVFGASGLALEGCGFGECVRQSVIDNNGATNTNDASSGSATKLSGGVIAGLAVVGALIFLALAFLSFGLLRQRAARRATASHDNGKFSVEWRDVSYAIPGKKGDDEKFKMVLDSVSGNLPCGQMMAILGPSGQSLKSRSSLIY